MGEMGESRRVYKVQKRVRESTRECKERLGRVCELPA